MYVESKEPINVPFYVTAKNNHNTPVLVECDKISNSLFEIGKTTVRCISSDSFGNEARESFVVTVGYNIVQIPNWFKQTTEYWLLHKMTDEQYFQTLEFLLESEIIHIPITKHSKEYTNSDIPVWIKTNAEKWINGKISNDEFSIGIQWILEKRMG